MRRTGDCAVCLKELSDVHNTDDGVARFMHSAHGPPWEWACRHIFCWPCIERLCQRDMRCPICRRVAPQWVGRWQRVGEVAPRSVASIIEPFVEAAEVAAATQVSSGVAGDETTADVEQTLAILKAGRTRVRTRTTRADNLHRKCDAREMHVALDASMDVAVRDAVQGLAIRRNVQPWEVLAAFVYHVAERCDQRVRKLPVGAPRVPPPSYTASGRAIRGQVALLDNCWDDLTAVLSQDKAADASFRCYVNELNHGGRIINGRL